MRTEMPDEMKDAIWDMREENLEEWLKLAQTFQARKNSQALGSPKEVQRQNLAKVLGWLYRWGYSTSDILSDLLGRKNRSHALRLVNAGWIQAVSIKGYPTYYVLTEKGLAEAIHHSPILLEYKESDPYRVHLPTLHHNLIAQKEAIAALVWYPDFITPRMYQFDKDSRPLKISDLILVDKIRSDSNELVNLLTGVEIELTPKWNHHLDMFVTNIVDDIQFQRLHKVLIISDSKAIRKRYKNAFQSGTRVKRWEKASGNKFIDTRDDLVIPEWVFKHVFIREVGSTASTDPYPIDSLE